MCRPPLPLKPLLIYYKTALRFPCSAFTISIILSKFTTTYFTYLIHSSTKMSQTTTPSHEDKGAGYKMGYSAATTSSHASRTVHSDAAFLIPHVRPHHKILDVGCGPGTITIGLADLVRPSEGGLVVGVDVGADVISSASELAASRSLPSSHVSFQVADVLAGLPFADGEFDIVYTSQTLTHLGPEGAIAALREIRRVLRTAPSGSNDERAGGLLAARDAAAIRWQPTGPELEGFMDRMCEALGLPGLLGGRMPEILRRAGWEADNARKTVFGGGATVVAGREKRLWWRDSMAGRLAKGDPLRQKWLDSGLSEEQVDAYRSAVDRWAEDENGWYGALQSEVLAWK